MATTERMQGRRTISRGSINFKPAQKSILSTGQRHQNILRLIHQGADVTPNPIPPTHFKELKERTLGSVHESGSFSTSSKIFKTESVSRPNEFMHITKRGDSAILTIMSFEGEDFATESADEDHTDTYTIENSMQAYYTPPMPEYVQLVLYETDTDFIFELISSTALKDTVEGDLAELDNKQYEYLTVGKGRNRKVVDAEAQTTLTFLKSRDTEAKMPKSVQHHTFASLWDMYDTYHVEQDEDNVIAASPSVVSTSGITISKEDLEVLRLLRNLRFLEALIITQRILANNVFNEQQKRFRGLSDPSPFRENIEYKYKLKLLWTWANEDTRGRCVTSLCWNPENTDILSVGYGKFYYDEDINGLILIWNIKNPVQPERTYTFTFAVTCTAFSQQNPNLLAVGFYNGDIKVIDIGSIPLAIIAVVNKQESQIFEPVWQVLWYTDHDYYKGQEFLAASCQDGKIVKMRLSDTTASMVFSQMMKIIAAEGKLKGIESIRKCIGKSIAICRHSPALTFTPHPVDPNIYYIGTGEGVVHKCSKNYYHQHLDLFKAHDSPMYGMTFSPFCTKMFLTCGDDWAIRLWVDGISEPITEIKKRMMGVQDVAWSPSHSTIVASISGSEIFIWDFQRKQYDSQSSTYSPTKSRNTLLKFTNDGRCLLVADIDGNVHVFSLEDMPFPAFFQENLLTDAILRALITRPDLLAKIKKIGRLSYTKEGDRYAS